MKLLLVEDDPMLQKALKKSLKSAGFVLDSVNDGESAYQAALNHDYDLILLDLGLPRLDGSQSLKKIRQEKNTPIIIISARDALETRLYALDNGADDYLIKPFEIKELISRIHAILRRKNAQRHNHLQHDDLTLHLDQMQLQQGETHIPLTHKEFQLLRLFMEQSGKILTRQQLEEKLYSWQEEIESNALDFLIHSLRKKIGKTRIKNIRGAGWLMP